MKRKRNKSASRLTLADKKVVETIVRKVTKAKNQISVQTFFEEVLIRLKRSMPGL